MGLTHTLKKNSGPVYTLQLVHCFVAIIILSYSHVFPFDLVDNKMVEFLIIFLLLALFFFQCIFLSGRYCLFCLHCRQF